MTRSRSLLLDDKEIKVYSTFFWRCRLSCFLVVVFLFLFFFWFFWLFSEVFLSGLLWWFCIVVVVFLVSLGIFWCVFKWRLVWWHFALMCSFGVFVECLCLVACFVWWCCSVVLCCL